MNFVVGALLIVGISSMPSSRTGTDGCIIGSDIGIKEYLDAEQEQFEEVDVTDSPLIGLGDDNALLQRKQKGGGEAVCDRGLDVDARKNKVIKTTDPRSLLVIESLVFQIMLNIIGDSVSVRSNGIDRNIGNER
jgi:hypothetical protein